MSIQFAFVLSPRTHFLDLAGPDQVFFEAIYFGAPFRLAYYSLGEAAGTSSGLRFGKLKSYSRAKLKRGDYIVLPGMDVKEFINGTKRLPGPFLDWLRDAYESGVNLCTICTGAFTLAASGLLNGRYCTTHWKYTSALQKLFPRLKVQENILFTHDDRLFTSAGIASGIDMALHIVEKELGAVMAHKVAREIVVYLRRSGREPQESVFLSFRNHIHSGIHRVQDWLTDHLGEKYSLADLSEMANMSERNFSRTFRKETGITPGDYISLLRKEKVKELMKNPDLTRLQIAMQVGLGSERQLRRILSN